MKFDSFNYASFRTYFIGQAFSLTGKWLQTTAAVILIYRVSHSASWLSILKVCMQLPILLATPIGGVAADRFSKRQLMIFSNATMSFLAIAFGVMTIWGDPSPFEICFMVTLMGFANGYDLPIRLAFVTNCVPRAVIPNGVALCSTLYNCGKVVGPGIYNVFARIFRGSSEGWFFIVNGIFLLAVLVSLYFISPDKIQAHLDDQARKARKEKEDLKQRQQAVFESYQAQEEDPVNEASVVGVELKTPVKKTSQFSEFKQGVSYMNSHPDFRFFLILMGIIAILGTPYAAFLPIFADEVLGVGAEYAGTFVMTSGVGSLVATLVLLDRRIYKHLQKWIFLSCFGLGLSLFLFASSRIFWLSLAADFCIGFFLLFQSAATNLYIQLNVQEQYRGRALSFFSMMAMGISPLGNVLAAFVTAYVSAPLTIQLAGVACGITGTVFWIMRVMNKAHFDSKSRLSGSRIPSVG